MPPDDGEYFEFAATFRQAGDGAAAYFGQSQAGVLRNLVSQVAELVSADSTAAETAAGGHGLEAQLGLSTHAEAPDDPVLARLLPDGYNDDPEAAAEFRRYTEESLRSAKVEAAQAVLASLPPAGGDVELAEEDCQQWLRALNDVRLALSVRLGITDEDDDLSELLTGDDPRAAFVLAYHWLGELQESLLQALTSGGPQGPLG